MIGIAVVALSGAGALAGSIGASAHDAAHTSGPSITVTPSTSLTNNQVVQVTGSGFVPADQVYVIECFATATNQSGCDTTGATPATIDGSGNLPTTSFTVTTGQIGATGNGGTCGTSASDLSNCVIAVANITGADRGVASISFAMPTTSTTTTTVKVTHHVPRHLFVHPQSGLRNNQAVRLTGQGFAPGDHLFIVECLVGAKGQSGCAITSATPVTANSRGAFGPLVFRVHTGTVGTGVCGTRPNNLNRCEISVGNASGADATATRITFRHP
ncbi:MAG: hypothetical protein KGJ39_00650 [Acidobacteriota bacterium]|nr:hypothetical protein [Acidobacteriota bacterium]